MRPKSLFLIVIALGCGLVASIGISQVLEHRSEGSPTGETEQVYVAMLDIDSGIPLTADMVKLEDWPMGRVPQGAITNLEDLLERRPRTTLVAGEVILDARLIDADSRGGAADRIPRGMRVSSVKVAVGDSPTGLVLPGDRVDVLCYFRASAIVPEATTKTILRNVTVFAVNEQTVRESDHDQTVINAKTVALLLTPEQDRRLMLATELGKLRLSLRRGGDDTEDESSEITIDDLLDQEAPNAEYVAQSQPEDVVNPIVEQQDSHTIEPFSMQIITSASVHSYEWVDEQSLPSSASASALGNANPLEAASSADNAELDDDLEFDPLEFDLDQNDESINQNELEFD